MQHFFKIFALPYCSLCVSSSDLWISCEAWSAACHYLCYVFEGCAAAWDILDPAGSRAHDGSNDDLDLDLLLYQLAVLAADTSLAAFCFRLQPHAFWILFCWLAAALRIFVR